MQGRSILGQGLRTSVVRLNTKFDIRISPEFGFGRFVVSSFRWWESGLWKELVPTDQWQRIIKASLISRLVAAASQWIVLYPSFPVERKDKNRVGYESTKAWSSEFIIHYPVCTIFLWLLWSKCLIVLCFFSKFVM